MDIENPISCVDCEWYWKNEGICGKAQNALSTMSNSICLARVQIMLLRSIWQELIALNDREEE